MLTVVHLCNKGRRGTQGVPKKWTRIQDGFAERIRRWDRKKYYRKFEKFSQCSLLIHIYHTFLLALILTRDAAPLSFAVPLFSISIFPFTFNLDGLLLFCCLFLSTYNVGCSMCTERIWNCNFKANKKTEWEWVKCSNMCRIGWFLWIVRTWIQETSGISKLLCSAFVVRVYVNSSSFFFFCSNWKLTKWNLRACMLAHFCISATANKIEETESERACERWAYCLFINFGECKNVWVLELMKCVANKFHVHQFIQQQNIRQCVAMRRVETWVWHMFLSIPRNWHFITLLEWSKRIYRADFLALC